MIQEISPSEHIEALAKELAKIIEKPEWAEFVKTGVHKERPPVKDDWWHMRAASVLRIVYVKGPIGVSKLRTKYGGKKNRGVKPGRFKRGSGKILRTILQQLEKAELIKQGNVGVHKGRMLTAKGKKLLNETAKSVYKMRPKPAPKPVQVPKPAAAPKPAVDQKATAAPAKPANEPQPKAPVPKKEGKPAEDKKEEVKAEKKPEVKKEAVKVEEKKAEKKVEEKAPEKPKEPEAATKPAPEKSAEKKVKEVLRNQEVSGALETQSVSNEPKVEEKKQAPENKK